MDIQAFANWLDGLIEGLGGLPTEAQIDLIYRKLDEVYSREAIEDAVEEALDRNHPCDGRRCCYCGRPA